MESEAFIQKLVDNITDLESTKKSLLLKNQGLVSKVTKL